MVLGKVLDALTLVANGNAECSTPCQGGCVAHFVLQREPADDGGIANGLMAFRGIDDEIDLLVLQHVANVRAALANLVNASALDTGGGERFRGAAGCYQRKPELDQKSSIG